MVTKVSAALAACAALVVGAVMLAAPAQRQDPAPGTERPGQATRAYVWIENHGRNEAIPIVATAPVPVVIENPTRQWEYQTLSLPTGVTAAELTRLLTPQGAAGWETSGVQFSNGANILVVLKRPRRDDARQFDPQRP